MGSVPEVHIKGPEDGGVCVVCMTSGWYPKPQVHWRDSRGENLPVSSETHHEDAKELFSTETSLVVRDSSVGNVTCSIFNPILGQEKVMAMFIPGESCPSLLQSLGCDGLPGVCWLSVLRFAHHWLSAWATEPFFPQASPWKPAFLVTLTMMVLLVLGASYLLRREHSARLEVQQEWGNLQHEKDELLKTKEDALRTTRKSPQQ